MTKSEELKAMLRGESTISQPNVVTPTITKSRALRQQLREQIETPTTQSVPPTQPAQRTMTERINAGETLSNPADIFQLAVEQGRMTPEEAKRQTQTAQLAPTFRDLARTQEAIKKDTQNNNLLGKVNSKKYFEYQDKLNEAKNNKDLAKEIAYQGMLDRMDETYKPMTKDWYNIQKPDTEYLKGQVQNRVSDVKWFDKKLNEEPTEENVEKYKKAYNDYQKAVTNYQDALLYQKYNNNPVLDELGILGNVGAEATANIIEGTAEDIKDNYENTRGIGYDNIDINSLLETNNTRKALPNKQLINPVDISFNALKYQAEKPNAGEEIKNLYNQILNGTYNGTAEDIRKILTAEKAAQNTFKRKEELQQTIEQKKNEFDWAYEPSNEVKYVLNALETPTRMIPTLAANMVAPGLGDITMYEMAGNAAQDKALAEGADYSQAGLNKTLKGSLEAATEHLVTSSIDKAVGRTGLLAPSEWAEHIANPLLRTGVGFGVSVVGEGVEEIPSAILDPVIDRITHNPDAPLATMEDVWGAFRDSLLPSVIMQGAGSAMLAVDNYANKVENRINNSGLTDLQKSELINQVENGRKEFIKQIEQRKTEIDAQAQQVNNNQIARDTEALNLQPTQTASQNVLNNNNISIADKVTELNKQGFNIPQSTANTLQAIQDVRGTRIEFDDTIDGNGVYDAENRIVYLNPNSTRAIEFTIAHELGHDIKAGNLEDYNKLQKAVLDYAGKQQGFTEGMNALDNTYRNFQEKQRANGQKFEYDINDEMTNDILGEVLGNQEFLDSLAQKQPNLFQKVWNWIKNVLIDNTNGRLSFEERRMLNKYEQGFRNAYQKAFNGTQQSEIQESNTYNSLNGNTDNQGRTLTPEQSEYFKDSKARDENGNLETLYHTTPENFTVFDNKKLGDNTGYGNTGYGFFVTPNQKFSSRFGDIDEKGLQGNTMQLYANIKNPITHPWRAGVKYGYGEKLDNIVREYLTATGGEQFLQELEEMVSEGESDSLYEAYMETLQFEDIFEASPDERKMLESKGYDSVEIVEGRENELIEGSNSNEPVISYAIFNPNQLKNIDNTTPTGNPDIRYSLSEDKAPTQDNQGRQLSEGQQSYFRDSKIKDVDGKLLTMYHGTNGDFYTFDLGKIGNNTKNAGNFGDGFYFTYSKDRAKDYGKNVKETYLNIQNPFSYDSLYYLPNGTESYSDYTVITNLVNMNNEWGKIPIKFESKYTWQDIADTVNKMSNEGATDSQIDSALYEKYGDIAEQGLPDRIYTYAKQEGYKTLRETLDEQGYDGIIDGKTAQGSSQIVAFNSNQIKNIDNLNPTDNEDIRYQKQNQSWQQFLDNTYGKWNTGTKTNFEQLPSNEELQQQETKKIENEPLAKMTTDTMLNDIRDFKEVGNRKVNAYQYDNPEVKPFFQQEAKNMLADLNNTIKGERTATWDDYGELRYSGVTRETTQDIADLLDGKNGVKLSYDDIRKGLEAIIKDEGSENIAAAKRIEMVLDNRLRKGYNDNFGTTYEPNENYLNFLAGRDFIDPAEYEIQRADKMATEGGTLFSLSEEQQNEVNDYINTLNQDTTLDDNFKEQILNKFDNLNNYKQFEDIKQEVEDYKDKAYKGISGLVDIANSTPELVRQRPMEYTQRKDKNTSNQRKFFDNVETSNIIADETKSRINPTTYEVKHNLDTLEAMRQRLDERGNDLVEDWKHKSKNFNDNDVALGAILLERYQQQGDWNSAARTAEKLADMSTETARALQMYSIWQRLSPETMQIFTQKQLNEAFEEMKQRKTGKWVEANKDKFKLTAEESQFIYDQVEKASQAIDEETKQRELSKIENMINNKLPPDAGQSIKALRRIAMLFNPKTQVRNIAGNTLIMPVNDVADLVGTAIDKAIAKKTGIRTTSVPNIATKAKGFAKGVGQAIKDYKTGTRTTASGNKYEFDIGAKPFNENTGSKTKNAIARGLNATNDLLSAVMSGGDRPFYEATYQNSLEGQMKANNVTEPTQEMIDIAVNEALQRTWNDDNNYTKTVLSIRKAMNNINIKGFGLGDLIIPFAKTPANLTKAMVEYSPAGFIESVIDFNDMRKAISRGEMTPMQQKKFVNSTSKAIAGSMLYLIAGSLVKAGAITGSADDDKDVKNFEQNVLGIQPYSVKLGDKTYTYSWANPINAPLAIMADTYKMSKEDASKWDILNNAFKVAGETLVDNSFLQGIKELFSKDSISEGIVEAIQSFPESLIPTFFSQIASLGDTTQRQTFEYKNNLGTIANKIKNKLPGARNTLAPQVNTFGEEIENQNNAFNAFISPANVREARITDEQKALYDVYQETKDKTIFPMQAPYNTNTDNGEKQNLTSKDRVTYQKASGKFVNEAYDGLFDDATFKDLENEGKVKILHEIATDGNLKGRESVGAVKEATNSNISRLNERMEELEKAGIPLADYYIAWYAKDNLAKGKTKDARKKAIRDYTDLTTSQENVLYEIFNIN